MKPRKIQAAFRLEPFVSNDRRPDVKWYWLVGCGNHVGQLIKFSKAGTK